MAIRAIAFDLDGTLYPAWKMYAVSADLGLRHPVILKAYGTARKLLRSHDDIILPGEDFRFRQARVVAQLLGMDEGRAAAAIDALVYRAVEARFSKIRPSAALVECLQSIKSLGYPLGLLSDLPPEGKLARMGLEDFFDPVICSEDTGALKPDIRPFRALQEAFGVDASEILYIGNKHEYDVLGARAAGMRTALLSRSSAFDADFVFTRWEELSRWLAQERASAPTA